MSNDLMLDVGQANELKMAFRRAGWTSADIAKLCAGNCATRILPIVRGEAVVSQPNRLWTEKDGVIYFTVTSDGTTGQGWIERLEAKGLPVSPYAKSVLLSPKFVPTSGITTQVAVLKGMLWKSDSARTTQNIRSEADRRKFEKPNVEVGCLIRLMFTNAEIEAMGLWGIVAMHDPIEDSVGCSYLLTADRDDVDSLDAYGGPPGCRWSDDDGFAFAAVPSQVF